MKQEAPRSIMGRRARDVNHLAFSVAKVLQKETGTLGQVPTVGCQPGGLRMHVWFKWIKLGLPAAGSKQSWDSHLKHSQFVSNCNYLLVFSWGETHSQSQTKLPVCLL